MTHFCTYCDQGYAARMLCLHRSLRAQGEPFRLYVLCFDEVTEAVVRAENDPTLIALPVAELLAADPDYAAVRPGRSRVEFYFTTTPVLVQHCLRLAPAAQMMIYLDADLFFFGRPSEVVAEQGDGSVGIVPHRHARDPEGYGKYGLYNVGWVSFRRDADGLACLDWWRERCLEWCYDRLEPTRYADQKYLDDFPRLFRNVRPIHHLGVNLAPWNVSGAAISRDVDRSPLVNGRRVLFYHYQGVREVRPGCFDPGLRTYAATLTPALREIIYLPYLRRLADTQAWLTATHAFPPPLGYKRLRSGASLGDRWERFKARWLRVPYRRLRGELITCDAAGVFP